jgi:hypothetical protein
MTATPSTKVVNCLIHDLAIEPDPELLCYQIGAPACHTSSCLNTLPYRQGRLRGTALPGQYQPFERPGPPRLALFLFSTSGYLPLI